MALPPRTALQSDRERFERALKAARAANDAERAAALAEASPDVAADEGAAEAEATQQVTSAPEEPLPEDSRATEREQRRAERRRAKAERYSARAEAKQRRAQDRQDAKAEREAAKAQQERAEQERVEQERAEQERARADRAVEVVREPVPEAALTASVDEQTALIAAMPEHTEVAEPEHTEVLSEPESVDEQTALIAAMPEHTEVVTPAGGARRRIDETPDDAIVEPPPALPVARKKSTINEKIGVLLVGLGALGLLCSVVLAVGALLAAIEVDVDAVFAGAVSDVCDVLTGPLSGLFSFSGENAEARNDLFARGIGSMIYLAIGLFLPSVARRRDS